MTDVVQVAVITSGSTIGVVVVNGIISYLANKRTERKVDETKLQVAETKTKVVGVETKVDGRLTEMLKAKDALMAIAIELAESRGVDKEKLRHKIYDATIAVGRKQEGEERDRSPHE